MVDWLLKGEPRKVQIEALRRSYYGESYWDKNPDIFDNQDYPSLSVKSYLTRGDTGPYRIHDGPAHGWGHLLQMRLGKTPTLLNEFELFRRDHGYEWAVIITPNKYKLDWPLEAERFGSSVEAMAFNSSDAGRMNISRWIDRQKAGILSINYEALRYESNLEVLNKVIGRKTLIAADESIMIKQHDGQFTKPAIAVAKECGARRILSGKPITQGPHDMWSQLRFIGAISGFEYFPFKTFFCQMGGFKKKQITGTKNEQRFHEILDKHTFRARRVDWLITPGVDYSEQKIELTPEQMRHYWQMQDDFLTEIENGTVVVADQIITKLIKLQQISSGFIIDENGKTHDLVPLDKNPRVIALRNMLENEVDCKVIIFCHFTKSVLNLQDALRKLEPAVIRGQMKNEDVVAEKHRFNTDPNCRVCIGQIQAVKYGHTLMGAPDDPCCMEVWFENNYSLNDRSQGEERPQGEGQQYPISVVDFVATDHDYAPIRALQRKEDVAAALLNYDRSTGILPPRPEPPSA